jgi:predicted metal-binding protein
MSKIERISVDRQAARLPKDLEKYCHKALELGATQAKIIPVQEIVVDDRVPLKCQIPRCFGYGAGAHC